MPSCHPSSCLSLYEYTGARLHFKSTETGTITVRYPVTAYGNANSLQPSWDQLTLTYIDSSANGSVSAKLIAVDECSGEEEELCSVTGAGSASPSCSFCLFPPDIDFQLYSYYVEGTVARSNTSADATLIVVSLGN